MLKDMVNEMSMTADEKMLFFYKLNMILQTHKFVEYEKLKERED